LNILSLSLANQQTDHLEEEEEGDQEAWILTLIKSFLSTSNKSNPRQI
jgi:hypothetical protein